MRLNAIKSVLALVLFLLCLFELCFDPKNFKGSIKITLSDQLHTFVRVSVKGGGGVDDRCIIFDLRPLHMSPIDRKEISSI